MTAISFEKKSVIWVSLDTISTALLSIGAMLIIARFIGPSDFGAASIILGIVLLVNLYVEGLFHDALIQNRDITDTTYEQAFSLVLIIAACVVILTTAAAFSLNNYLGWVSVLASASLLFSGPLGVANARQRRELAFEQVARASVLGKIAACAISITLAWMGFGIASIIMQYLAGAAVQTFLLYLSTGWRPRLSLSFSSLGPLLRFALPYAFMHTIVGARTQGFALLIASLMGLSVAGFVNVAFRFAMTPFTVLVTTLTNLCFPLLAHHQKSGKNLEEAFALVTKIISVSTLPIFIGLALVADDMISFFLGQNWQQSIVPLQIIAVANALLFSRLPHSLVLRALGYVRYSFWNACFQLALTLGGLAIMRPEDPIVAVVFWVLPITIQLPISWILIRKITNFKISAQFQCLAPSVLGTLAMILAVIACKIAAAHSSHIGRLVLCVAIGGATYSVMITVTDRQIRTYFVSFFVKASEKF